jgi:hypothetical protein
MRVRIPKRVLRPFLVAIAAGLLSGACALDKVKETELVGPSEQGVSVQLTALPDTVNADGISQVQVELKVRANSGEPLSGLAVLFHLDADAGGGIMVQHPGFTYVGPVQDGIVMATDTNGAARVIYTAGTQVGGTATISVRPYGIDGNRLFTARTVDILQR